MLAKLLRVDVELSMGAAMADTSKEAIDEQRKQLAQGLQSNDQYLPDYSFRSVFQYNKPPGPIRLYDTGAFYRGIGFDVYGDIFILESEDSKTTMLKRRYGPDILGLGTEAKNNYIKELEPVFINEIRYYLK